MNAHRWAIALTIFSMGCHEPSYDQDSQYVTYSGDITKPWGIVLGGLTDPVGGQNYVNIIDEPEAVGCDLGQLGVSWLRVDLGLNNDALEHYTKFADHLPSDVFLLALVHVRPFSCDLRAANHGCGPELEAWTQEYLKRVTALMDQGLADAYEIGNEPNIVESSATFVQPEALAHLQKAVYQAKLERAPRDSRPLIVSAGIANTAGIHQPDGEYYNRFVPALGGGDAPYDAFGVHPYNPWWLGNLSEWASKTASSIATLEEFLEDTFPNQEAIIWATEIGAGSNAVGFTQNEIFDHVASTASKDLDVVFWYDYRDDEPGPTSEGNHFGVRWSSVGGYHAKPLYHHMATRLGGSGDDQACYPGGTSFGCEPDPAGAPSCGPDTPTTKDCRYFSPEELGDPGGRGRTITGAFHRFWTDNGGLPVFGYPLGEARCLPNPDPGTQKTTPHIWSQWFERQRMEYHPEWEAGHQVALGRLGAERVEAPQGNSLDPFGTKGVLAETGSCKGFLETGQTMCGDLLKFYDGQLASSPQTKLSSLELLGYPITPAFETACPVGNATHGCFVQYTERARLEVHFAEHQASSPYYVQLGLLGHELAP